MTRNEMKKMLSAIDKHITPITNSNKFKDLKTLANCVLALSAIIQDIMKI